MRWYIWHNIYIIYINPMSTYLDGWSQHMAYTHVWETIEMMQMDKWWCFIIEYFGNTKGLLSKSYCKLIFATKSSAIICSRIHSIFQAKLTWCYGQMQVIHPSWHWHPEGISVHLGWGQRSPPEVIHNDEFQLVLKKRCKTDEKKFFILNW